MVKAFHFLIPAITQTKISKFQGTKSGSGAESMDVKPLLEKPVYDSLHEEMKACTQILVDSEMQNGSFSVLNFAMDYLDLHLFFEKLDLSGDSFK